MDYVLHLNDTSADMNTLTETTDFGRFVQMQDQKSEAAEAQV